MIALSTKLSKISDMFNHLAAQNIHFELAKCGTTWSINRKINSKITKIACKIEESCKHQNLHIIQFIWKWQIANGTMTQLKQNKPWKNTAIITITIITSIWQYRCLILNDLYLTTHLTSTTNMNCQHQLHNYKGCNFNSQIVRTWKTSKQHILHTRMTIIMSKGI